MTEHNEPSMEDILASIRNILADEEEKELQETAPVSAQMKSVPSVKEEDEPEDQNADSDEPGLVDLTADMIVSEAKKVEEALIVTPEEEEEDDFTPEPVIPSKPMKEETLTDLIQEKAFSAVEEDMLISPPTIEAAAHSLSSLREFAGDKKMSLGNGALTIEAIVRETLKPYLKEWLDVNLPAIVERIVKKEVAHIMDRLDLK